MADAIVRTLFRLFVTRRRLLEWMTAAQAASRSRLDRRRLLSAGWAAVVALAARQSLVVIARPREPRGRSLRRFCRSGCSRPRSRDGSACRGASPARRPSSADDARALRLIARRTWRFFETFVDPERPLSSAGQLPGGPRAGRRASHVADQYRTLSPLGRRRARLRLARAPSTPWTGWSNARHHEQPGALPRPSSTTGTTRAIVRPLEPEYVSTVDSGNLAGTDRAGERRVEEMAEHRRRFGGGSSGMPMTAAARCGAESPSAGRRTRRRRDSDDGARRVDAAARDGLFGTRRRHGPRDWPKLEPRADSG